MADDARTNFGRGLLTGALGLAIAVQLFEFVTIDAEVGSIYAARSVPADPDLLVSATELSPTVRERFALYAEIGLAAPDAEVVVWAGSGLSTEQLYGLAGVRSVRTVDAPLELSAELAAELSPRATASGTSRTAGPYVLVVDDGAETLVAMRQGEELFVVDARLLPEGGLW